MKSAAQNLGYAAALNPSNTDIQLALSSIYNELGAKEAARNVLESLVNQAPDHVSFLNALGSQLNTNNEYERATDVFNKILKIDPSNSNAWNGLAKAKLEMGLRTEGAKALIESINNSVPSIGIIRALFQLPSNLVPLDLNTLFNKVALGSKKGYKNYEAELGFTKANISLNNGDFEKGYERLQSANKIVFEIVETEMNPLRLFGRVSRAR